MILDEIVENKKKEIEHEFTKEYTKKIMSNSGCVKKENRFYKTLIEKTGIAIIAEIKKASPSKGIICEDFDVSEITKKFDKVEIEAISVLTEKKYFLGNVKFIDMIKDLTAKPVLRKDFIIDERQVYESAYLGADAILLIASVLNIKEMKKFIKIAEDIGLDCLVESHDEFELERALESDARLIGINNRDLKTFDVSIDTTMNLIDKIPKDKTVVSESGIFDYKDMQMLCQAGVKAALIGEAFMKAGSIEEQVKRLRYGN